MVKTEGEGEGLDWLYAPNKWLGTWQIGRCFVAKGIIFFLVPRTLSDHHILVDPLTWHMSILWVCVRFCWSDKLRWRLRWEKPNGPWVKMNHQRNVVSKSTLHVQEVHSFKCPPAGMNTPSPAGLAVLLAGVDDLWRFGHDPSILWRFNM